MFMTETNGYDKIEVQRIISELEIKVNNLTKLCREKDAINLKLATAVNKANEIKFSSENLSNLKFQRFVILFKNFERMFSELFKKYPQLSDFSALREVFNNFINDVRYALDDESYDTGSSINSCVKTENDTIRLLLNKMQQYAKSNRDEEKETSKTVKRDSIKRKTVVSIIDEENGEPNVIENKKDENNKFEKENKPKNESNKKSATQNSATIYINESEKPSQIKPISQLKIESDEDYETIADKFLEISTQEIPSVYAKLISSKKDEAYPSPNESGFDLKKAVNPTEDLSTIMKSFNFN
ncbi:MAG: hypothetical protein PHC47_00590 [Clostridia bacterium]|nr:hypothetical protein [Clostridia bacterium]